MKLVIVESPGKTESISKYLGAGFKVMASYGHVRDLPEKDIGVDLDNFRPTYVPTERGKNTIANLAKEAAKAEVIYLATDPDREGEAISWHLQQSLGLKEAQRVTFNEISAQAVQKAIQAPRRIDVKLVAAQEARRVLDRLCGYLVSPPLCELSGQRLSAGRVQSPALRLLVERERAIKNFKPTNHFGATIHFDGWFANWDTEPHKAPGEDYILDRALAEKAAGANPFKVVDFKEAEQRRSPPAPFITTTLQKAGLNRLGIDPEKIMAIAQSLYEAGHITYMRTDNPNLSIGALEQIAEVAESKGLPLAAQPRTWKAKEGAQEAHEAIRPVHFDVECAGNTDQEQAVYRLIWIRALASQLADARYKTRTASLASGAYKYTASGSTLIYHGWKRLMVEDDSLEASEEEGTTNAVPQLQVGQELQAVSGEINALRTKAPKRFTKVSLIDRLEHEGIGRPSTYVAIMKNLEQRGYFAEKNSGGKLPVLIPTEPAFTVVDALAGRFDFIDLEFTRNLEGRLDQIAAGTTSYKEVVSAFFTTLNDELARLKVTVRPAHPCPNCGAPMRRVKGAKGNFWGCTSYPECSCTLPDNKGKPGSPEPAATHACKECGKPLRRIKGKSGYFWGCSGYPTCHTTYTDSRGTPSYLSKSKHQNTIN